MKFRIYGDPAQPAIMLIHGASWAGAYLLQAERLQERYYVILPILDGHGGEPTLYSSTNQSSQELLAYIDEHIMEPYLRCAASR